MIDRRSPKYRSLINSTRWQRLRRDYLTAHPLCEACEAEGRCTLAAEVHHKVPVDSIKGDDNKERLAYDIDNLMAVCQPCHLSIHNALRKNDTKNRKERLKQRLSDDLTRLYGETPGGDF